MPEVVRSLAVLNIVLNVPKEAEALRSLTPEVVGETGTKQNGPSPLQNPTNGTLRNSVRPRSMRARDIMAPSQVLSGRT